ncbi:MAG: excinuclease ABC subunit UvrC [Alphaproteobacteria bacterium]|nr:excinuclease ABC subunit UvrC [Alphaproteobacteria bacterium]
MTTENASSRPLRRGRTGFQAGANVIKAQLRTIPRQSGVYRMLAAAGVVLYVGKAKNLKKRVESYTQRARLPHRLQRMVAQVRQVEIVVTRTEAEALLLEASLIQRFMPPFNVLLRDDKSYPCIVITRDHDFPQLLKHRGARVRKGWYFGPFASAASVDETLILLQRGFLLRNCSNSFFALRSRPCLQYHIKRCTAPCVGKVSKEAYACQVEEVRAFLSGKSQAIQASLAEAMQDASAKQDYERAALLRDRIRVLTSMQARQDIHVAGLGDADVIALHRAAGRTAVQVFFFRADRNYGTRTCFPAHDRAAAPGAILSAFIAQFYADKEPPPLLLVNYKPDDAALLMEALTDRAGHKVTLLVPKQGDKKRLIDHARQNAETALTRKLAENAEQTKHLARFAELFGLPEPPKRIEVYDNSHLLGRFAVGAMIAAGSEGFLKKTYRKFTIREAKPGDDFAMMREVLTRRFRRLMDEDPMGRSGMWPEAILIDGGQGQLNKVRAVLQELGLEDVAAIGIAKGPERHAGRERFFVAGRAPFSLPPDDPLLYYLQRLRDEAHRFAIGAHRAKRVKAVGQSGLEEAPGVGAARKRALLHHFGSAKAVAAAAIEELTRVKGISSGAAKKLYDYFHATE